MPGVGMWGMYGGWWQISLQAKLSDRLEMLAESAAHRLASILVLFCAGTNIGDCCFGVCHQWG